MKAIKVLLATVLASIGVALTYYYFEAIVHHSIDTVWDSWLNTGDHRWLVVPTCLILSLVYFGVQHTFDPKSENKEEHGLGNMPVPTATNFGKVLLIGFFSLLAGASLGPEAILVPACMILGSYIGVKSFAKDKQAVKLLGMVGFIALMAAFFHSFLAGMLGLLLAGKQAKLKISLRLVVIAAVASAVTTWLLGRLSSPSFVSLPATNWHFNIRSLLAVVLLAAAGYLTTYGIGWAHQLAEIIRHRTQRSGWPQRALVAAIGLSALYLLGGTLVEFTGNESIVPMLHRADELGVIGLLWILVVKICAISWSKALGYRGGLVFPAVFVASVLVAIAHSFVSDVNFIYGLIAVLAGLLAADRNVKILL